MDYSKLVDDLLYGMIAPSLPPPFEISVDDEFLTPEEKDLEKEYFTAVQQLAKTYKQSMEGGI